MSQSPPSAVLPWLEPGQAFPPVEQAWGEHDPAPGLLAAGGVLDVPTLIAAYSQGIFPWYSSGQPILWWSTHPRMVLRVSDFRLHRSLRKTIGTFLHDQIQTSPLGANRLAAEAQAEQLALAATPTHEMKGLLR